MAVDLAPVRPPLDQDVEQSDLSSVARVAAPVGVALGLLLHLAESWSGWVFLNLAEDWSGWTPWMTSALCLWLLASLGVGRQAASGRAAAFGGSVLMVVAVLSYHVTSLLGGGTFPGLMLVAWLLLAVLVGPAAGRVARASRSRSWKGAACSAGYGGLMVGAGTLILLFASGSDRVAVGAVQLGIGLTLPVLLLASRRDRLRGYALLPIAAAAAGAAMVAIAMYASLMMDG